MTPVQMKAIIKDLPRYAGNSDQPICAFGLRNGQILTGHFTPLSNATQVLVLSLADKDAPPIYINVEDITSIAVSSSTMPAGQWPSA